MKKNQSTRVQHKTLEDALMVFRHSMNGALLEEAKKKGYSLSHFEVLKYIAEVGNPSMKDIASQLHITPPSTSALIDVLVAKNLVNRSQTPDDRRTIHVTLTPKAQVLIFSLHKKKKSIFDKMLSGLNHDDKNELARILIKCITN